MTGITSTAGSFTSPSRLSAAALGLCSCRICGLVSRLPSSRHSAHSASSCPRCNATLHQRKRNSIARTWALLITAYLLYIPANLLPIMDTNSLFDAQHDTILSGIAYLWDTGSWPTAIIVFVASIVTPLFKLLALTLLLVSVQRGWDWEPQQRTRLYRLLDGIGRWSMLDIFMVSILITLMHIKSLAVIKVSPGAVAFAAVVVLTMLAVKCFDPRLIWDSAEEAEQKAMHE